MNWEVIPEIFFDLVARVVPGSLLLLTAFLVSQGPEKGLPDLVRYASSAGFGSVLAFALVAYFIAVVLKQAWCFLGSRVRRTSSKGSSSEERIYQVYSAVRVKDQVSRANHLPDRRIMFSCIRHSLPEEGLRLLKIQAEKNLCEVVLPGLAVLLLFDSWLLFNVPYESFGRTWLLIVMVVSWLSFFSWKADLEELYQRDLCALWRLLEVAKKDFVLNAEEEG